MDTPKRRRNTDTSRATAALMKKAEHRKALQLTLRGWVCIPAERVGELSATQLIALNDILGDRS